MRGEKGFYAFTELQVAARVVGALLINGVGGKTFQEYQGEQARRQVACHPVRPSGVAPRPTQHAYEGQGHGDA